MSLHHYADYGWLRGFSIVPSWGARIEEAWWRYDPLRFRQEIEPARLYHANTIRLWLEYTAWMANPAAVTEAFLDAVAAIDEAGMKTMPCLFNRWHDSKWDYGGQYDENLSRDITPHFEYVESLATPLANDDRILIWDLCNEPAGTDPANPAAAAEYRWLTAIRDRVVACGARQPITIGTMMGSNIGLYAPLVDVLCCHPYIDGDEAIAENISRLHDACEEWGKPMLCNETGLGGIDDEERSAHLNALLPALERAGIGWMGWALRPGMAVSTRLDRLDTNGLHGLGYHPWVNNAGDPRTGFEWLTQRPARLAPWLGG